MTSSDGTKKGLSPLAWILIISGALFALFLIVSGVFFMGRSSGGGVAKTAGLFSAGSVGVIELNGPIMDSKKTLKRLERFDEDDRIKAVVLRLNSPGGAVAPSQEIYEAVKAYKKPLVVSMSSVAASGAYYIATGAKKVYANPGTITGSIGVIMEFANLQKLYEWAKIERYSIRTGKFKGTGAEYRQMTPEERALLQEMVDDVLGQFKAAVAAGRKLKPAEVTALADGRIFSGAQAKAAKLVDELGTLQDAINDAAKQANITGKPNVIYPEGPRRKLLEYLLDSGGDEESSDAFSKASRLVSKFIGPAWGEIEPSEFEPGIYWLWSGAR